MRRSRPLKPTLLLIPLSLFFFIGGPDYHAPRSHTQIWNLGHILFFALLTLQLQAVSRFRNAGFTAQCLIAAAVALGLGVVIEIIQAGLQRTVDIQDLFKNLLGAMVGGAFLLPSRKSIPHGALMVLKGLLGVLLGLALYPLVAAVTDEYRAWREFPRLADFETRWEMQRWSGDAAFAIVNDIVYQGRGALRVDLTTDTYSGVALSHFPGDWSGYRHLKLEVHNPGPDPLPLTCRIHDATHTRGPQRYHDRFNRRLAIQPGWNTITIGLQEVAAAPRERALDLQHIRGLGIFAARLARPRTIYLDGVRLER